MNQTTHPEGTADVPWLTSDRRTPVPDTSLLPGSETAPAAAVGVLKNAVQGAHDTIDRLADSAEPAVRQIGERVAAAGQTRDAWVEDARSTVRARPLVSVAVAFVLGAVIARLAR